MAYLGKQIRKNIVITLTGLSMTGSQVYALPRLPNGRCQPSRSLCLRQERRGRDNNNYPSAHLCSHPDTKGRRVCRATSGLDNTLDAISLEDALHGFKMTLTPGRVTMRRR